MATLTYATAFSGTTDIALALLPWQIISQTTLRKREKFGALIAMSMGVLYASFDHDPCHHPANPVSSSGIISFLKIISLDDISDSSCRSNPLLPQPTRTRPNLKSNNNRHQNLRHRRARRRNHGCVDSNPQGPPLEELRHADAGDASRAVLAHPRAVFGQLDQRVHRLQERFRRRAREAALEPDWIVGESATGLRSCFLAVLWFGMVMNT